MSSKRKRNDHKVNKNSFDRLLLPTFFILLLLLVVFFFRSYIRPVSPVTCVSGDLQGLSLAQVESAISRCYPNFSLSDTNCRKEISSTDAKSELAQLCIIWLPDLSDRVPSLAEIQSEYENCISIGRSPVYCNAQMESQILDQRTRCDTHPELNSRFSSACLSLKN